MVSEGYTALTCRQSRTQTTGVLHGTVKKGKKIDDLNFKERICSVIIMRFWILLFYPKYDCVTHTHACACVRALSHARTEFSSVQDGIRVLRKAHMCALHPVSQKFPHFCFCNTSFNAGLIDNGPFVNSSTLIAFRTDN